METAIDWIARVAFFALIFWLGYERGRRIEVEAQCARIDALIERIADRRTDATN